jgi:hypothetical protein
MAAMMLAGESQQQKQFSIFVGICPSRHLTVDLKIVQVAGTMGLFLAGSRGLVVKWLLHMMFFQ